MKRLVRNVTIVRGYLPWLGVALLSASWLFGLGWFRSAQWANWATLVFLGTSGFLATPTMTARREGPALLGLALAASLPAVMIAPWPYRIAILLFALGTSGLLLTSAMHLGRVVAPAVSRLGTALLLASLVLIVQGLMLTWYESQTARSHELPAPLPQLLSTVAGWFRIDAAAHGSSIALHSMRQTHLLGATWELLLDPATLGFLSASIPILVWSAWTAPPSRRRSFWGRTFVILVLLAVWLPLRAGLLMAIYLNEVLRTDYDAPLLAMRLFWSPWLLCGLLAVPVILCGFCAPRQVSIGSKGAAPITGSTRSHLVVTALCVVLGVSAITWGVLWDPAGARKAGRVVVEEYHPLPEKVWEPTNKPYDTTWYGHQAGYNYYCIYDYCSHFYDMQRTSRPLDDATLDACDVLVLKVPTRPYANAEIEAVKRFVERGGGLLLIGEHTDVYHTSEFLNPVARLFGIEYRHDCVFGIDAVFEDRFEVGFAPHPALQYCRAFDFATSCSLDCRGAAGRAVIQGRALKNLMADYHSDNYYPQPVDSADMRYGSFVQMWAARFGRGRVLAFTDSTIFSNFCVFEPGKSELMLGALEWLNHESRMGSPRGWLNGLGVALLAMTCLLSCRAQGPVLLYSALGLLGWAASVVAVQQINRAAMRPLVAQRRMVRMHIDRTICDCGLSKNGFVDGTLEGFGIFERWMLRLGYFTSRRKGESLFDGDVVVFLRPHGNVTGEFERRVADYVQGGGKMLIVDSPRPDSASNQLLTAFGLSIDLREPVNGVLRTMADWPSIPVSDAAKVAGGEPFAWINGQPVAAKKSFGRGAVFVLGCATRFCDANMGRSSDVIPDKQLQDVFEVQFALLRWVVETQQSSDIGVSKERIRQLETRAIEDCREPSPWSRCLAIIDSSALVGTPLGRQVARLTDRPEAPEAHPTTNQRRSKNPSQLLRAARGR